MTTLGPGKLQTVSGIIDGDEMGVTLPHEHLFNDLSSVVDEPSFEFSRVLRGRAVAPELMWALRQDPYCCQDNMAPKDVASVSREVTAFAELGGRTIVDATGTPAIGRVPTKLVEVAEQTGLNVVMSTGAYLEKFEGERITARTVDAQAMQLSGDVLEGVGSSGIKAGMIGEVGVSPSFTPGEQASLRAGALAQTGLPSVALNIHMPGWQRRGPQVLDIVLDEMGANPAKVSLAHSDPSGDDLDYQRGLLDRGVWLEFDMIGLDITFPKEGVSPTVNQTCAAIARLVELGYSDQIVLSHDLFLKQMWTHNGGNGFAFVPTVFLELLEQAGVDAAICRKLVTDNPRRLLTA
ncbi:phosphotriesterase family protein [Propionibacterium freudenreichii]|uniref:phosphotriesterase family protein n=1 Tax=Propionibacterium freudenreichii TaxID=1744 RepID=UPI001020595A|nr:phosphotriesterase [Propionibacterium freudenreichii]MCT2999964.1 phosphotriesterase [Propionibacterium freudenreichii]MDK9647531.1 phosphotriesterase [Propionibacterium freudenreichii]MDK9655747.1 phosphotriesterase [Propionibacterium freudenreichii]MDK9666842.1 phosphotriesterase [Propionibacterium freudenreichii]